MYAPDANLARQPPREQRLPAISGHSETERRQRHEVEYQEVTWPQEQYRQDARQYRDMLSKRNEALIADVEGLRAELRQVRQEKDAQLIELRREYREDIGKKDETLRQKDEALRQKDELFLGLLRQKDEQLELLRKESREDWREAIMVRPSQSIDGAQQSEMYSPAMPSIARPALPSPRQPHEARQVKPSPDPDESPTTVASVLAHGGDSCEAALTDALEHSLEALETLLVSTPRHQRKTLKELCEKLESALEEMGLHWVACVSSFEASELTPLAKCLSAARVRTYMTT